MDPRRHRLVQRRGWDQAAPWYEHFWQRQLRPAHRAVIERAALRGGERVLDVACGSGAVTVEIARLVGPSGHVVATDLSPRMVAAAEAAAASAGLDNVECHCCDAERLSVDGPFDVGLCSLGLMYTPDPGAALGELHRVVRPGGRVAIAVWGDRHHCGWAGVFGIVDARVSSDVCPRFFALGSPGVLAGLMTSGGFVDVEEVRLRVDLDYCDGDEAIGAAFLGGPVALAYARFDAATRAEVHEEYLASIAGHAHAGGGYRVPGEFVVVAGRRAGPASPCRADSGRHHVPITQREGATMTTTHTPVDNGVDTAALLGAREALSAQPAAAAFTWRATCSWVHGTHSTSTVAGFSGLGQDLAHRTTFRFEADHPECFASQDLGATPVEYVLVGLASCLTAGVAAVAQHRQIQLRSVTATLEGDMNVLGILGADPDVRNGFEGIRVRFDIDADATRAELEALVAQSQKRSAVFDVVTNPTSVVVELA